MFQPKPTNSSADDETQDDTHDSSSANFSQLTSTVTVQKRTSRASADHSATKKIRTA